MELKLIIEDDVYSLNVPDTLVAEATEVFDRMDREMDRGWQMGRDWVAAPDIEDRIRIVGDRLLTAIERDDHDMGRMMAAYILNRAPNLDGLTVDTSGEPAHSELHYR